MKTRILLHISAVLVVSMLISTMVASIYFTNVMRNQIIRDEQSKLLQLMDQINFKTEDIISFANSIAVDPSIQSLIAKTNFKDEFQKVKTDQQVDDRLIFYNSLRNHIGTATIRSSNGNYYSSRGFKEKIYFSEKFSEKSLIEYEKTPSLVFSNPFYATESTIPSNVMCYKISIRNINKPSQVIGTLYLDIYEDYFQQEIKKYADPYEDVLWTGGTNQILYQKNQQIGDSFDVGKVRSRTYEPVLRLRGGYLISEKSVKSGWTVSVLITDSYILNRSSFVLIFFLLFLFLTTTLIIFTINPVLKKIICPITKLTETMGTVRQDNLQVKLSVDTQDEIALLYQGFNDMISDIKGYIAQKMEYEQKKKEMEFDIMLSQINPHYLYNVLNTVVYLAAAEKNYKIVEIVNAQIKILQENLQIGEDNIFTTISNELEIVNSYVDIQKYRYPNVFELTIDVEENLMNHQIPKTIIQPLVENAIFHGIVPGDKKGMIKLRVYTEGSRLIITVRDNGIGMEQEKINQFHRGEKLICSKQDRKRIGMANVRDRIEFIYGKEYGIRVKSTVGEYTIVRVELPYDPQQN